MPRFLPRGAGTPPAPATVFDQVNAIVARVAPRDLVRLDMGDTCLQPPPVGRPTGLDAARWPGYNLYADTRGVAPLRAALAAKLRDRNGLAWAAPETVQVTCGAVHALFGAFKTLLAPGEEVLVPGPRWPLVPGVVRQAGGVPVEVPFYVPLLEEPRFDPVAALEAACTERTAALYLNTPNNPSGAVLDRAALGRIAAFAERRGLWIVSDEAYEDFVYEGPPHLSIGALPGMERRALTVCTFSKCLAAAGYRVGYVAAQPDLLAEINRTVALTVYNAPTAHQQLALQALERWNEWFPALKADYRGMRDRFVAGCPGGPPAPAAGFYAFLDVRPVLDRFRPAGADDGVAALALVEELVRAGVALLPGEAFGRGFEGRLRACYIAEPADRLLEGLERLRQVLGGDR